MRFLFFPSGYRFAQTLALFIIGIFIGAAIANLAIGYQVENLHSEKVDLEAQLSEKESQIKALEDKVSDAKRWLIVQEIQIELELPQRNFADKQHLQLEIEQQVKSMLKDIRGKRVRELDPQVIWHIIDRRKIEALGYQFTLQVKSVLVSEKIFFYIFAEYHNPQQSEPV